MLFKITLPIMLALLMQQSMSINGNSRPLRHMSQTFQPHRVIDTDTIITSNGRKLLAKILASGLDTPTDLSWGPDGQIWVTERLGRISRIDPTSSEVTQMGKVEIGDVRVSGLMSLAFHPDFSTKPHVFLTHSFPDGDDGFRIRNRLIRMTLTKDGLDDLLILVDSIPGRSTLNGGRMEIGPDQLLYLTTGDAQNPESAQSIEALTGKILRLALDGGSAQGNPFGNRTWTFGHRNPQGLVFFPRLGFWYSTEHGPFTDDEVNRIDAGGNYGWPEVKGACDLGSEMDFCSRYSVTEPMVDFTPTIGISGIAVYDSDMMPEWRASLLIASLIGERLIRLSLTEDGLAISDREDVIQGQFGRLRDVLVGPDGFVYVVTSNRDHLGVPSPTDDRLIRIGPPWDENHFD